MDPIIALGLASAVCQFVQFSSSLVKGTTKLYQSREDKSKENEVLEDIYGNLQQLSTSLKTADSFDKTDLAEHHNELRKIAEGCWADSELLLSLVSKLKLKTGRPRWWASFNVALNEVLAQREIRQLKERIEERERVMTLQLVNISRTSIVAIGGQIQTLILETRSHSSLLRQQASELKREMTVIDDEIKNLQRGHDCGSRKQNDVDRLSADLLNLCLRTKRLAKEEKILHSLNFDQRPVRHDNITDAHEKTLSWVLERSPRWPEGFSEEEPPAGTGIVLKWLESGHGIFWISGKAGSGKSTVMKFIANHESTKTALSKWAAPNDLVIGSHYFWSTGTTEQKSLQGMLRSLLHDFIAQASRITSIICPDRWCLDDFELEQRAWSPKELYGCLRRLANQSGLQLKFCAFIDGLDEYNGDHLEMAQTLGQLSQSLNIKLCVSSRPWNVFEENFGSCPSSKIYIHEWTRADIREFSRSRITTHHRWSVTVNQDRGEHLINNIAMRAEGVFLWVFLVTKQLREGLTNHENIDYLNKLLNEMPSDLGQFFMHILNSVSPIYHKEMARALRIADSAGQPLHFPLYHFAEIELTNPNYALQEPVESFSNNRLATMQTTVNRHLNGRCMGLLELRGNKVQFIHRTVRDWLQMREVGEFLATKEGYGFEAYTSIAHAHLAWMKRRHYDDYVHIMVDQSFFSWQDSVAECLRQLFVWVDKAVSQGANTGWVLRLIDEADSAVQMLFDKGQARFGSATTAEEGGRDSALMFRWRLLESRVWSYLGPKLCIMPDYFKEMCVSPLDILLGRLNQDRRITLAKLRPVELEGIIESTKWPVVPLLWTLIFQECTPGDIFSPCEIIEKAQVASFRSVLASDVVRYLVEYDVNSATHLSPGYTVPAWLAVLLLGILSQNISQVSCKWTTIMESVFTRSLDLSCLEQAHSPGVSILRQVCLLIQIFSYEDEHEISEKRKVLVAFLNKVAKASPDCTCADNVSELLERFTIPMSHTRRKRRITFQETRKRKKTRRSY
ncbi:hypothetical protein F4860DRAFT_322450 [Xylaria cubensis]|nr:hypothetical protein F4860DRAFT_322450 [Xylaria cubensis]